MQQEDIKNTTTEETHTEPIAVAPFIPQSENAEKED